MKKSGFVLLIAVVCGLLTSVCSGLAQNTAFMYQGQLSNNGSPADGSYDLVFTLFDSTNEPGNLLAGPVTNTAVLVSNGLFSTLVDFGNAYAGTSNWLEIAVSTNGANAFSTLAPRQQLTPVPEALYAHTASNVLGTVNASQLSGIFSGNGSGLTNVPGTVTQSIVAGTTITAQPNTAYDVTNASLVSVTLPASANVGDVIQVNGTGSGGWQVLGNQIWAESTSSGTTSQQWQSIASSASGSNLVAGAMNGGIWTSTDKGATWTESTTSGTTNLQWRSIASSASGSNLVAVTYQGAIWTSANSGVTWTKSSGTSQNWYAVASSASGSNLVAVAQSGGGIWTSTNSGATWTQSTSSGTTSQNWYAVASSASGSNLVAVVFGGGIWTSANSGMTWTESTSSGTTSKNWTSVASSASGSNLVAVALNGGIWTSTDSGVTWTQSTSSGTTSQQWYAVASSASGSNLVAVVRFGGIWTSSDSGVTWAESTSSGTTSQQWQSIASSASGSNLVAVVYGGGIWTLPGVFTSPAGNSQEFQYLGNGVWQPLTPSPGDNGQALTNLNASQLTIGTVPLAQLPAAVVMNNESGVTLSGSFTGNGAGLTNLSAASLPGVVVTNNETGVTLGGSFSGDGSGLTNVPGALMLSVAGGTTITAQPNTAYDLTNSSLVTVTLPASANVGDVVQVNGTGSGGWQVVENPGTYDWTESTSSGTTSQNWISVTSSASGSNLVAVVRFGGIWTSSDSGVIWTESTSSGTIGQNWISVTSSASGSNLVAVVYGGGIWTSTDSGVTWTQSTSSGTTSQQWYAVACSASGSNLVAVVRFGGIWTSSDSGVTWTESTSSGTTSQQWWSVASSASGSNLVAVVYGGGIWTSTDSGVTWTESTSSGTTSQPWWSVASSASGSNLVAVVYGGGIWTSTDSGVTWTESTSSGTIGQNWISVTSSASGSNLVAVVYGGGIWTSTDSGVTWTESTSSGTIGQSWASVTSSASGSNLVAVVYGGGIWTLLEIFNGPAGSTQEFQYLGNDVWQPLTPSLGDNGQALTNLNASQLTGGTVPLAQLPAAVVMNNEAGVTLSGTLSGNGNGLTNLNYNNIANPPVIPSTNGFVTASITNGLATTNFVTSRGYLTSANGGNAALATNVVSGISITNAFITNSVYAGNGSGLTSLTATNLNGTVSQGNLGTTNFFTPTIGNGSANFTTSTQSGYYARVGNLVYFEDWVVWSSKGSVSSGNLVVSLPPIPIASNRAVFNIGYFNGINVSSQLAAFAGLGNTEITISTNSGSGMSVVPVSDCNAVGELQITGTYRWQ